LSDEFLCVDEIDETIKVNRRRDHHKRPVKRGVIWIRDKGLLGERIGLRRITSLWSFPLLIRVIIVASITTTTITITTTVIAVTAVIIAATAAASTNTDEGRGRREGSV